MGVIPESVWKAEEDCTEKDRAERRIVLERAFGNLKKGTHGSFLYFLGFCKIIEPPKPGQTGGGIIPLKLWPHLLKVISTLLTQQLISVLKARQIGLSTIIAAYILWYAMSHMGANILLFSKGQPEAKELLAKSHRIYDQLPDFMRLKLDPDSTEEIGFKGMKSSITAKASTASAGISYTSSIVVSDEHAEHPYAEENYLISKPTRDAGGQYISIFTANAWEPDNLATALFEDAREGKNDFEWAFFDCWSRPGRDEAWYEATRRNIPDRELRGLTRDLYMTKNYPRTIEEALRIPQTTSAFSHDVLDSMMGNVKNSIELGDELDPQTIHIYKDFHIGDFYIAATDTSHGVGKDFSVTAIMNVRTGDVVADIMRNDISPEELALQSVNLLNRFRQPLWYIESNDYGGVTIATAQRLGYKNFGYQDTKEEKIGFNTHSFLIAGQAQGSRVDLWGGLIPAINNRQITIYNKDGLKQFYDIIRNVKKEGRIEATGSRHDDYPLTIGICWLKKDEVSIMPLRTEPIQTLTFKEEKEAKTWKDVLSRSVL